jgi:hypothetical protein
MAQNWKRKARYRNLLSGERQRMLRGTQSMQKYVLNTRTRWLYTCLLAFVAAVFIVRGPLRALAGPDLNDLISPHVQSIAWIHGEDPYSAQSLFLYWPKPAIRDRPPLREVQDGSLVIRHGIPTAYPITCFVVLSPFTVLPWPWVRFVSVFLSVGLFAMAVWCLAMVGEIAGRRRWILVVAGLLLAPIHTGIATCNLAIIATELGIISLWANNAGKGRATGILVAICTGLKPQIGLCFLAFLMLRRRWRASALAIGAIALLVVVGLGRMQIAGTSWLAGYESDSRALLSTGVLGDFTERDPLRFGLINLQVGVYPLIGDRNMTNLTVALFSAMLVSRFAILLLRKGVRDDLLTLSTLAVLTLIPIYHRFYDAALLLIPLCYLLRQLGKRNEIIAVLGVASIAPFLVPGGTLLQTLRDRGSIPARLLNSGLWNSFVMAHEVWCLMLLALVLLYQIWRQKQPAVDSLATHLRAQAASPAA